MPIKLLVDSRGLGFGLDRAQRQADLGLRLFDRLVNPRRHQRHDPRARLVGMPAGHQHRLFSTLA